MRAMTKKKKRFLSLVVMAALLLFNMNSLPTFAGDLKQGNIQRIGTVDENSAENVAVSFVRDCFSDGALQEDPSPYIAKEADSLRNLVAIRKEIRENSTIKGSHIINFTVQDIEVDSVEDGVLDIYLDTMEEYATFPSNEIDVSRQNIYRMILIKENGEWKVMKAIADDYSGSCTHPTIICNDSALRSYDFNQYDVAIDALDSSAIASEVKETKAFFEQEQMDYEMHKEEIERNNIERDRILAEADDIKLFEKNIVREKSNMRAYSRRSFNRTAMYNYQNQHWNASPIFSSDCTNYASEVVRSGGAVMDFSGAYKWFMSYPSLPGYSRSWTVVRDFRDYFINNTETEGPQAVGAGRYQDLQTGDIIQMRLSGHSDYNHACVVLSPGGDPVVTAHTNPYKGTFAKRYNKAISGNTYKIHLTHYYA